MILDIGTALQNPGVEYSFTLRVDVLPDEDPEQFPEGFELTGTYLGAGESVFVRGTLKTLVKAQCARCLGDARELVEAAFDEAYVREADPDDPERNAFFGHALDLSEQLHATIWLNMPMRFLCRPDCLGLCPVCGADQNQAPCSCQKERTHPLSALSPLLTEDEEV